MTLGPFNVYKDGMISLLGLNGSGQGPIVGATSVTYNAGIKEQDGMGAGQISPSFNAIMEARPTFDITCYDIGTAVTNGLGTAPLAFGSGQACSGIIIYGVQAQNNGEIVLDTGGSSGAQMGISFAVNQGMITMDQLSAKQGSPATAKITVHPSSPDGVTNPVTITPGVDLPSVAQLSEMYTVGLAELNSGQMSSINSVDYNARYKMEKPGAAGSVYNTVTYVSEYKPELNLGSYDASLAGIYPGTEATANFAAYLQSMANMSSRSANNTAVHVKIAGSADQALITTERVTLNENTSDCQIKISPIVAGNPVLAISLAQIT
jgi:hypothetical protein